MTASSIASLKRALSHSMCVDRPGFRRRLRRIENQKTSRDPAALKDLECDIERSRARAAARRDAAPRPEYPDLPIIAHRADIVAALGKHQVVVVAGETGSGKTTQLPKLCLEAGLGITGYIGVTQPRRIAARSIATRVAEEIGTDVGEAVGYKVRFKDRVNRDSYIKLMTDGILLAEMQGDRFLDQYDTLIIDEAHERSLNIDFVLGYLKRLLRKRRDLKVIISSATIDTERFSRFFDDAPVIEVSGRTYPVEIRYRPLESLDPEEEDRNLPQAIIDAVDEASRIDHGDILVFLSGEREIRETAELLRKHHLDHTEIVPLYSRLSAKDQNRVFHPGALRRIVLATNVAETSLTVPRIRYVVDPGYARISRYSFRAKVQRLPVERISQASADQRAGRCGRVSPGVCLRLYDEEDYLSQPRFTDPEILRTNLASVVLQMKALGLGEIKAFPFIDPPEPKRINDGFQLLWELGAVDERRQLTRIGSRLARLPVDPRIGRMVLAARDENCLKEMLPIAAALSIQDPRERPAEAQKAADERHQQFHDPRSDFVSLLRLWETWTDKQRHLSKNKQRRFCRENFLSFVRMREWQDLYTQLRTSVREMGWEENIRPAEYPGIHRALLAGLVSHIARKERGTEYTGARGSRVHIFPGSGLFGKAPKWIVAAELVETSRLFARTVARIQPEWAEQVAPHLVKREYFEPHWAKRRREVVAFESVMLYGLTVVGRRKIPYAKVDRNEARTIFIRQALVAGEYETRAGFFQHNQALLKELSDIEHRVRRTDILANEEEALFRFYDERLPEHVCDGPTFEAWRQEAEQNEPHLLYIDRAQIAGDDSRGIADNDYPDEITVDGLSITLDYHFEPGHPADGVTAVLPVTAINALSSQAFAWLVPGLLQEKVVALIRSLPKSLRRHFVPAPTFAEAAVGALSGREGPLLEQLARELHRMTGVEIPRDAWRPEQLPPHLFMNFRILDDNGQMLAQDRNLEALQDRFADYANQTFDRLGKAQGLERTGITEWDFGRLSESIEIASGGVTHRGFPTLIDQGDSVALRIVDSNERAGRLLHSGLRRLVMLALSEQMRFLRKHIKPGNAECLAYSQIASGPLPPGVVGDSEEPVPVKRSDHCAGLREEIIKAAVDATFLSDGLVRSEDEFRRRLEQGRNEVVTTAQQLAELLKEILDEYRVIRNRLEGALPLSAYEAVNDIREQLHHLLYPGFITRTPVNMLREFPRYLAGIRMRLDKLEQAPAKDKARAQEVAPHWRAYLAKCEQVAQQGRQPPGLDEYRWLVEEFRISLFAQELKTAVPVSAKRLNTQWGQIDASQCDGKAK